MTKSPAVRSVQKTMLQKKTGQNHVLLVQQDILQTRNELSVVCHGIIVDQKTYRLEKILVTDAIQPNFRLNHFETL